MTGGTHISGNPHIWLLLGVWSLGVYSSCHHWSFYAQPHFLRSTVKASFLLAKVFSLLLYSVGPFIVSLGCLGPCWCCLESWHLHKIGWSVIYHFNISVFLLQVQVQGSPIKSHGFSWFFADLGSLFQGFDGFLQIFPKAFTFFNRQSLGVLAAHHGRPRTTWPSALWRSCARWPWTGGERRSTNCRNATNSGPGSLSLLYKLYIVIITCFYFYYDYDEIATIVTSIFLLSLLSCLSLLLLVLLWLLLLFFNNHTYYYTLRCHQTWLAWWWFLAG